MELAKNNVVGAKLVRVVRVAVVVLEVRLDEVLVGSVVFELADAWKLFGLAAPPSTTNLTLPAADDDMDGDGVFGVEDVTAADGLCEIGDPYFCRCHFACEDN